VSAPSPVDAIVNPNNKAQRYVLWGTGRVDNYGGAPPITSGPAFYDRPDQPVCVAIWITDWTTGAGYVLDFQGGFQALNGAPQITTSSGDTFVNNNGLPYVLERRYADWSWNPANNGQGVVCDVYGELFPFGGATAPPRGGPLFSTPAVRAFEMQWSPDKRSYILDSAGAIWKDWNAVSSNPPPPYFGGDVTRDLAITDWTAGAGYMLTGDGAAHPFGGAVSSLTAGPYRKGADLARTLVVLSATSPLKLWQVHAGGESFDYYASTPPTVTAGGISANLSPAATVTTTTQPTLAWAYSDPQQDAQAAWQLYLFTQAYATANPSVATDPTAHAAFAVGYDSGVNPTTRGTVIPVDLTNQAYRYYVRVQDAAGMWSGWATRGWTQNVPVPVTPSALGAVPNAAADKWQVALSVSVSGTVASFVRFEYSDDGGTTWAAVLGADRVPRAATTQAVDYTPPPGVMRGYRAIAYSESPRTASSPSTAAFTQAGRQVHVLTTATVPPVGGEVRVIEAPSWTNPHKAGVFEGLGARFATVIKDGNPAKGRKQTLVVETNSKAEYDQLLATVDSGATLLYREPYGGAYYCEVVGDVTHKQQKLPRYPNEPYPERHNHVHSIPLQQVAQP
jgi:hypothetical protein